MSLVVIRHRAVVFFLFGTFSQSILPFRLCTKSLFIDPILKVKSSHFCGGQIASCGVFLSRRDCGCCYRCCLSPSYKRHIHRHRTWHLQHTWYRQWIACLFSLSMWMKAKSVFSLLFSLIFSDSFRDIQLGNFLSFPFATLLPTLFPISLPTLLANLLLLSLLWSVECFHSSSFGCRPRDDGCPSLLSYVDSSGWACLPHTGCHCDWLPIHLLLPPCISLHLISPTPSSTSIVPDSTI